MSDVQPDPFAQFADAQIPEVQPYDWAPITAALVQLVQDNPGTAPAVLAELQRLVTVIQSNAMHANTVWNDTTMRLRARLFLSRSSTLAAGAGCALLWKTLQAAVDACPRPDGAALN